MTYTPLLTAPGICKVDSSYASGKKQPPRYTDGDHVRFVAGFPEKIGGWARASDDTMVGVPRIMTEWRNQDSEALLAIGTETHLYYFDGTDIIDITPLRTISTGTLTDPFSTTDTSTTVTVADASQQLQDGDHVFLSAGALVGGLTILGWFTVDNRTGAGYTIESPTAATSTAGPGGGTVDFSYPRITLTNPFTTVNGSTTVTVDHTAHGATTGDYVVYSGASAVGGLTLNGEFQLTVVDPDTYTIESPTPATSSAGPGGGSVSVIYDITIGQISGLTPIAYGVGPYGVGPYGYSRFSTPTQFSGWSLAAYGSNLLASPIGGTIYIYDPTTNGRAYPVLNAPTVCLAIFVTPERFLFALGINGNEMEIAWPDQNDITNWTTTPANTANEGRSLQGGAFMIAGRPVANGVSLFFSNSCCFQAAYTGDNTVYDTPLLSDQANLIGPGAITTMGGVAYWMSDKGFWMWNGTVLPIPSDDIRDYVFDNINTQYQSRSIAGTVAAKREVWFFYPADGSTDVSRYVIWHIDTGAWSIGTMDRPAWFDSNLFSQPFGCDAAGVLYSQEFGANANGASLSWSISRAPSEISDGNFNMDVFGFVPDFERLTGAAALTVTTQNYPMSSVNMVGPFVIEDDGSTARIDMRADGRLVGFALSADETDSDFRLGLPRANVQRAGARR